MLPAAGSGLREFWEAQMYSGGELPDPIPSCVFDGIDDDNNEVEPARAFYIGSDDEILPHPVSSWGAQAAGISSNFRGTSRIGQIDHKNPFAANFGVGTGTVYRYLVEAVTWMHARTLAGRGGPHGVHEGVCAAGRDAAADRPDRNAYRPFSSRKAPQAREERARIRSADCCGPRRPCRERSTTSARPGNTAASTPSPRRHLLLCR